MRYRITNVFLVVMVIAIGFQISFVSAASVVELKAGYNDWSQVEATDKLGFFNSVAEKQKMIIKETLYITTSQHMVVDGSDGQAKNDLEGQQGVKSSSISPYTHYVFLPLVARSKCTVMLKPGSVQFDGRGVPPGAVICLEAGDYTKIAFRDLHGTAEKPITIQNDGGQVRGWNPDQEFYLCGECSHIHLTGTGTPGVEYGFYFRTPVKIYSHPHHIEVDHIEMAGARLSVKDTLDPDFEMTDIRVHHCYMHDSPNAFYLGVSKYNEHPGEFISRRVEVDHNLFENNGGRALKVTGIVEDCIVHDNVIRDAVTDGANAALSVSEGTKAEIYNNVIVGSGGCGILMNNSPFSAKIYNNLLIDTGGGSGGYVDAILAWSDNNVVYNNTIIGAGGYGVAFRCDECGGNEAFNNIIIGTAGDSIDKGGSRDANFHHNLTKEAGYALENLRFVDSAKDDYHLTEDSPAVDAGADSGLRWDLDNRPRPVGRYYDIGAYEYGGGLPTPTPTNPPTATSTPLPTSTPTFTPTNTPTPTPTSTPIATNTPLPTYIPTRPPSSTPTPVNTPTPTPTETPPLPTWTPTATNTPLPTYIPTRPPSSTPTPVNTPTPTNTPNPTATSTPLPTDTPTPTSTPTSIPTETPSPTWTPTATNTPLPTYTSTPTSTDIPSP